MEESVKQDVLVLFEYAHNREDWVTPLAEALKGVTVQEALWKPGPDAKGIWEIVLHMAVWTEHVVQRLQGENPGEPAEGPWPSLPADTDLAAWDAAQQRLREALSVFRSQLTATSPAQLLEPSAEKGSLLDDVVCRFIHNAYHTGQITKLRECYPVAGTGGYGST